MKEKGSPAGSAGGLSSLTKKIQSLCSEELVKSVNGIFEFDLQGEEPGLWYLDLKNGAGKGRFFACDCRVRFSFGHKLYDVNGN